MNAMIFVTAICPQSCGDWYRRFLDSRHGRIHDSQKGGEEKPQRKGAKTLKKAGNDASAMPCPLQDRHWQGGILISGRQLLSHRRNPGQHLVDILADGNIITSSNGGFCDQFGSHPNAASPGINPGAEVLFAGVHATRGHDTRPVAGTEHSFDEFRPADRAARKDFDNFHTVFFGL
jgi:hypothetical protein